MLYLDKMKKHLNHVTALETRDGDKLLCMFDVGVHEEDLWNVPQLKHWIVIIY